jgi:hypothetical protein
MGVAAVEVLDWRHWMRRALCLVVQEAGSQTSLLQQWEEAL